MMPKFTFLLLTEYIEMLKRSSEKNPNAFLEYKTEQLPDIKQTTKCLTNFVFLENTMTM